MTVAPVPAINYYMDRIINNPKIKKNKMSKSTFPILLYGRVRPFNIC